MKDREICKSWWYVYELLYLFSLWIEVLVYDTDGLDRLGIALPATAIIATFLICQKLFCNSQHFRGKTVDEPSESSQYRRNKKERHLNSTFLHVVSGQCWIDINTLKLFLTYLRRIADFFFYQNGCKCCRSVLSLAHHHHKKLTAHGKLCSRGGSLMGYTPREENDVRIRSFVKLYI